MSHDTLLKQLVAETKSDSNKIGFLLFGSMARGTHHEDSDIDVITILRTSQPTSGINNTLVEGIKVGNIYFTYDILIHSVEAVPYLLHPLAEAKLLFEREDMIKPLLDKIQIYFEHHPEIVEEWHGYYQQLINKTDKKCTILLWQKENST